MAKFREVSIKRKLTVIILFTTSLVLLLTSAIFIITELVSFRREMVSNISTLAQVMGINSTAALSFQDPATAEEILTALSAEPHVVAACIYTNSGDVFATYKNNEDVSFPSPHRNLAESDSRGEGAKLSELTHEKYRFSNEYLEFIRPIILNDKRIGKIYIRADLKALYSKLKWLVGIVVGVMLASFCLALLMSSRLQRIISEPISTLARTMKTVSSEKNYGVRAQKRSNDEIGFLIDGFNDMIRQIQQEIIERNRAEGALRQSEEKYKTLIDSSLTGIFIHQDEKYLFVNDRFAEMHGYEPGELLGKDPFMLIHPNERTASRKTVSRRLKGEPVPQQYEVRRLRKDGRTIWCEMMATLIEYEGRPAVMGNMVDITRRKRAEEERRKWSPTPACCEDGGHRHPGWWHCP